jgi:hypothetical protein
MFTGQTVLGILLLDAMLSAFKGLVTAVSLDDFATSTLRHSRT